MPAMWQPDAQISAADKLFDAARKLSNPSTPEFPFMQKFADWVASYVGR